MKRGIVAFDLDGTLFQSEELSIIAAQRAMVELGLAPAAPELVVSAIGETIENYCRTVAPGVDNSTLESLGEGIRRWEWQLIPEVGELYEGTEEMLRELRDMGYTLAICSNGGPEYIERVLNSFGIAGFFSIIRTRGTGSSKEENLASVVGEAGGSPVLMVGDRHHDIEAAACCGIPSVGAAYGFGYEEVCEATYQIGSPIELISLIRELEPLCSN